MNVREHDGGQWMARADDLGDLLGELKQRSGRSYAALGLKVNVSKSAMARYCTGLSVPPEFGTVERIARACGAGPEEISRLFTVWNLARSGPVPGDDPPSASRPGPARTAHGPAPATGGPTPAAGGPTPAAEGPAPAGGGPASAAGGPAA